MLRVAFSPAPECVVADCWNRVFSDSPCHPTPVIVVIVVIVASTYLWRRTLFLTTPLMEFVSGEKKNTEFVRAYVSGITFFFFEFATGPQRECPYFKFAQ